MQNAVHFHNFTTFSGGKLPKRTENDTGTVHNFNNSLKFLQSKGARFLHTAGLSRHRGYVISIGRSCFFQTRLFKAHLNYHIRIHLTTFCVSLIKGVGVSYRHFLDIYCKYRKYGNSFGDPYP